MPSTGRLVLAARRRNLPARTRLALLRLEASRRWRPHAAYALPVGDVTVYLSHADYEIDWASFAFVALDGAYVGDYDGAVVVDIGAHKGYYAAYALLHGARAVIAYEPERVNFALLEQAAKTVRSREIGWLTERCAVGAERGEGELHVMGASWGHALHPPEAFAEHERGTERVRVEALRDVLVGAVELAGGRRLIVKVNIEGEECPTILGTDGSAWDGVDDVYVETHPWATCGAKELERHLAPAGFTRAVSAHPAVLRLRRAEGARSAPRSVPS